MTSLLGSSFLCLFEHRYYSCNKIQSLSNLGGHTIQYALDLIFKTLVDDKEKYPYLTTMPETTEQTNSIMLELLLRRYSRKYRKYLKKLRKEKHNE